MQDARRFAHGPRRALAAAKEALRGAVGPSARDGVDREKELFIGLFEGPDQREGMRAFLEKRTPEFRGVTRFRLLAGNEPPPLTVRIT